VKNPTKDVVGFHISPETFFEKDDGISVLFLYANERGMSTIPSSIALLSKMLKDAGHRTALFDTTFYKFDDELVTVDPDEERKNIFGVRPVADIDDESHFKKTTRSAINDFNPSIMAFQPRNVVTGW